MIGYDLKNTIGKIFWKHFPKLVIGGIILFIIMAFYSLNKIEKTIHEKGLKSIFQDIWEGKKEKE